MARAAEAGVSELLVPGVRPDSWAALRELAARFVWRFGIGTHPVCLPALAHQPVAELVPTVVDGAAAIGECGLDGLVPVPMERQEAVLAGHLALARDAGLPLILHCYKAHDRLVPLLRRFAPLRGVLHSFSAGPDLVPVYVKLGLHLSFAGPITYENARRPILALRAVPRERLLAETDSPDQCPRPFRGRSEPAMLPHLVTAMERHRDEPLREALFENARVLFG